MAGTHGVSDGHFLFVANDVDLGKEHIISVETIFDRLMEAGFWAFSGSAQGLHRLQAGDRIIVYLAGHKRGYFAASASIACSVDSPSPSEAAVVSDLDLRFMRNVVRLSNISRFSDPVRIRPLVNELSFIKDKKNFGLNLRLPVFRLPKVDYDLILRQAGVLVP